MRRALSATADFLAYGGIELLAGIAVIIILVMNP